MVGPKDVKLMFSYDTVRSIMHFDFMFLLGLDSAKIDFDKLRTSGMDSSKNDFYRRKKHVDLDEDEKI